MGELELDDDNDDGGDGGVAADANGWISNILLEGVRLQLLF